MVTGQGMPSGTVTLLLGDVEKSTRHWETDPEGMREAMASLNATLAEVVGASGGVMPIEQGEGDSFVAAFERGSAAVGCALALQLRLQGGLLRVRLGLHTGEIDVVDNRYQGTTIVRTARLRDIAHGGQIVVSSATRDLVADVLPDGAGFLDLGSHRLKGLERPERVAQLTHPDLGTPRFPHLRSEASTSTLPAQLTPFIGRAEELAEAKRAVAGYRMVTFTGAGGCGKTRMAIETVSQLSPMFDEVWYCDLAALADPEMVPQAVRIAIGAEASPVTSDTDVVRDHVASRQALLVVDNCEHVIAAVAELLSVILGVGTHVHVLATSREPLGVAGEVTWRVPSLRWPASADADDVGSYDAVALFLDVATRTKPGFALTAANAAWVVNICARLDGIPLALELAAARLGALSVEQIAEGLNDRFRLLGRGHRTVLARQQTLLASVGWSHDLLNEEQRVAFRRLAVFAGSFDLPAGFAVVDQADGVDLIAQLVDRSLLVLDDSTSEPRFRLLETLRQYASEKLLDAGEADTTAARHLAYYAAWAEALDHEFDTSGLGAFLIAAIAELDNVRAACEWAIESGHTVDGLRLAAALERVWVHLGEAREAQRWLEALLVDETLDEVLRLKGYMALTSAYEYFNESRPARAAAAKALPLAREVGDLKLLARLLVRNGEMVAFVRLEEGLAMIDEAIEITQRLDLPDVYAEAITYKGSVLGAPGSYVAMAEDGLRAALPGGEVATARPRFMYALSLANAGELDLATEHLRRVQEAVTQIDDHWARILNSSVLASIGRQRGGGLDQLEANFRELEDRQRPDGLAFIGALLAPERYREGNFEEALRVLDLALPFFTLTGGALGGVGACTVFATRAATYLAQGDEGAARNALAESANYDPTACYAMFGLNALYMLAITTRALGHYGDAESYVHDAGGLALRDQMRNGVSGILDVAAALRTDVGADLDAVRLFAAADALNERMGILRPSDPLLDVAAIRASLSARTEPEAYEEAELAGAALSPEDAIEFASRGRGKRNRPSTGWESLTPTEAKVTALVSEGLSNPQIGEKLFISARTVSTHLSHVFAKLNVASRSELAAKYVDRRM